MKLHVFAKALSDEDVMDLWVNGINETDEDLLTYYPYEEVMSTGFATFDGLNDYIDLGDKPEFDLADMTLMTWVCMLMPERIREIED